MTRKYLASLAGLWLAWVILLFGFQELVPARLGLARPDYALSWTANETKLHSQDDKPYLRDPVLNTHVSWDSEFYLAIATKGYDAPDVRVTNGPVDRSVLRRPLSLSYAFMPFYPIIMRGVALPLQLAGGTPIATATLAGVLVSVLGALAAMVALADLTRDELGEAGGLRTAFYLLIFPTGFFLAQVYTEGLFVGLAFSSLALLRRNHWLAAALLAVAATWTRTVGVALVLPLALAWWQAFQARGVTPRPSARTLVLRVALVLLPLIAYVLWHYSFWGQAYSFVEETYFNRGLFALEHSWQSWSAAVGGMFHQNTQWTVYYALELAAIALAVVACGATLRRYPGPALFGLAVLIGSLTSGEAQGMLRYVLAVPAVFIFLSRLGKHLVTDRAWTLASVLLMSLITILFSFDMWAG